MCVCVCVCVCVYVCVCAIKYMYFLFTNFLRNHSKPRHLTYGSFRLSCFSCCVNIEKFSFLYLSMDLYIRHFSFYVLSRIIRNLGFRSTICPLRGGPNSIVVKAISCDRLLSLTEDRGGGQYDYGSRQVRMLQVTLC